MRFLHSLPLLGSAASFVLVGCSSGITPIVPAAVSDASAITGNWQLASAAPSASRLSELSGQLTGTSSSITGIFHSNSNSSCVAPSADITLTGSESAKELVSLTGQIAGGNLTLSGTLSADGRTLTNATYNVTGGTCAFTAAATVTAQSYSPVTGTYMGTFTDVNGNVTDITASVTQSPTSDTDGNFLLSGTSTLPNNACFEGPIAISNAQVTGGSFVFTYTDPNLHNSVTANGTFSTDANTLTVASWVLTGPCGSATGTGIMYRQ